MFGWLANASVQRILTEAGVDLARLENVSEGPGRGRVRRCLSRRLTLDRAGVTRTIPHGALPENYDECSGSALENYRA
ncbi:hypothetical protein [Couchioplanes caeruleus]|uniref:Uncharacterized protein n=2 Tax=Couchioplanes caeruleus TaxID=56438 RepID=A0A1K0GQB8_9ACTN|nr:hypothetical protein [Couchioplanes caeruleus]OJF11459.1 hypothetical protein BG844_26195 [Couchioplanes caeruleus subsp. caeruleus]